MTHALDLFSEGKIDPFLSEAERIQKNIKCLNEIPLQSNVPEIHRFQAYYAYATGDGDRVEGALSGWLFNASLEVVMSDVGDSGLSESVIRANELGAPIRVPFLSNESSTTYLDGARVKERGLHRSTLVQFSGEDGRVVSTHYVHAGEQLPSPLIEPANDPTAFGTIEILGGRAHRSVQTDCSQVDLSLNRHLDTAITAFSQMDKNAFSAAAEQAERAIPCSPMAMTPSSVAAFFRVRGLWAFMEGKPGAALRNFQSAFQLQPGFQLPSGIATPGSEIHTLYQLAQTRPTPTQLPFLPPSNTRVLINGKGASAYIAHAPNVVQLLDKKDRLVSTFILEPGERLPPPFPQSWEAENKAPPKQRGVGRRVENGRLVGLRLSGAMGMMHRFYREGLATDGTGEPSRWLGYGAGFRADDTPAGGFGLILGTTSERLDVGISLDIYLGMHHEGEAREFEYNAQADGWHDPDFDQAHDVRGALLGFGNIYARYRFPISPIFDIGLYIQAGMGIYKPDEIKSGLSISCSGNPERCPLGDPLGITFQAGIGPSMVAHVSPSVRIGLNVPFTAIFSLATLEVETGKHALDNRMDASTRICTLSPTSCEDDDGLLGNQGDTWSNNAYGNAALGEGFNQVGWMGAIQLTVEFILPAKK